MTTNNKEYQLKYMKDYIKNSKIIICPDCNTQYKKVYEYKHFKTHNHLIIIKFKKDFNNLSNNI